MHARYAISQVDVRHRLRLNASDQVEFVELESGRYAIRITLADVSILKGSLRRPLKLVSVDNMNAAICGAGIVGIVRSANGEKCSALALHVQSST